MSCILSLSFSKTLISQNHQLFLSPAPQQEAAPRWRRTIIRMGGGPRTFPGGVSKWQWKRMQAKKGKQLLKARLSRERQIYEMRKRAELKAAVAELERPWEPITDNHNRNRNHGLLSVSADEQVKVLADRFQRPGGFDLWSDCDGPQLFHTPHAFPSARFFPKGVVHSIRPYAKVVLVDDHHAAASDFETRGFMETKKGSGDESHGVNDFDLQECESGSGNTSRGIMRRKGSTDNYRGSRYVNARKNGEYGTNSQDADLRKIESTLDFESEDTSRGYNDDHGRSDYETSRRNCGYRRKSGNVHLRGNADRFSSGSRSRTEGRGDTRRNGHNGANRVSGYAKSRSNDGYERNREIVESAEVEGISGNASGYGWNSEGKDGIDNGVGRRNGGNFTSSRGRRRYGGAQRGFDSGQFGFDQKRGGLSRSRGRGDTRSNGHHGANRVSGYAKSRSNDGYERNREIIESAETEGISGYASGYGWNSGGKDGIDNGVGRRNGGNFTSSRGRRRYVGAQRGLDSGQFGFDQNRGGLSRSRGRGTTKFNRSRRDNMTSRREGLRNSWNCGSEEVYDMSLQEDGSYNF